MATKHTTGPWVTSMDQGEFIRIEAEQGKRWDNPTICTLYEDVTPEDSVTIGAWLKAYENAHANARLIAAAPDLLEALESLYHAANSIGEDTCDPVAFAGALEDARAAIEKAKGE